MFRPSMGTEPGSGKKLQDFERNEAGLVMNRRVEAPALRPLNTMAPGRVNSTPPPPQQPEEAEINPPQRQFGKSLPLLTPGGGG